MRVFISQPMRGLSTEEVRERRAAVVERLNAHGHTVIDSIIADAPPEMNNQALWYLGGALQILATCDAIYMMDGWEDARGCRLEHAAAEEYGIQRLYEENGDLIDRRDA